MSSILLAALGAALPGTAPVLQATAAAVPAAVRVEGGYQGAVTYQGGLQLVELGIRRSGDSVLAIWSTPDLPFGPRPVPVGLQGRHLVFGTPHGLARLAFDSGAAELTGTIRRRDSTVLIAHFKRVPPPGRPRHIGEDVTIASAGVTLAGTVVRPVAGPVVAAVVMVAGRGCGTRVGPLRTLEALAPHGIAGIAIDKRGMGGSTGNCPFATIEQFSDDALAALGELRRRVDSTVPIGLLGESAGGWVSVHAAARAPRPVDFLILRVGPATSVEQQQRDNLGLVTKRLGLPPEGTARMGRYVDLMFASDRSAAMYEEMMATVRWAREAGWAEEFFESSDIPTSVGGIDSLWVRLNRFDPGPGLGRLRIPILAVYGGADEVVPPETNVPALRRATAGNDRVRTVVIPDGGHGLVVPAGPRVAGDGERYWRFARLSPLYLEAVIGFLTGLR